MARSTKHYHVISGMRGYMPDYNAVYKFKSEAEAGAREWVRSIRDDGGRVVGSASSGWYEVRNPRTVGVEYIEITKCHEPECLEELD